MEIFDEIPKKENGKINKEFIEEMFNLNLSLPFVISRETGRDYAEFELCFIKNSNFLKGILKNYQSFRELCSCFMQTGLPELLLIWIAGADRSGKLSIQT